MVESLRAFVKFLKMRLGERFQRRGAHFACRHVSAQLLAARLHILDLRAVIRRTVKRRIVQFVVRDGNAEPRAEHLQLIVIQLFLLMGDVLTFTRLPEAVAFDGLG